jgi:hypothetical protein
MRWIAAAVILGGAFGTATATVESVESEVMVVELEVEVMGAAETVVAHLSFDNEPVLTLPLLDRGDGLFGIRTELEPKNYVVIFEVVGEESSDPVSLTQMGADLGPESGSSAATDPDDEEMDEETRRWLWLAVALGAGSLSVLAFWVLGGRDSEDGATLTGSDEEE